MKINIASLFVFIGICFFIPQFSSAQWVQTNTPWGNLNIVSALAVNGNVIFAGTASGGIYRTTDNGTNWTAVNSGLPNTSVENVHALAVFGNYIIAGSSSGVFWSYDSGSNWYAFNSGLTSTYIQSLVVSDSNIFAGANSGGVFRSNKLNSWSAVNSGLPAQADIRSFAVSGTNIFAGVSLNYGVFRTTNNGTTWTSASSGIPNTSSFIWSLVNSNTNIFAGTAGWGVFLSSDNGTSWTAVNSGLTSTQITALTVYGSNIFAGGGNGGVFLSTNNGTSWAAVNSGLPKQGIYSFVVSGGYIFAGTINSCVWRRPLSDLTSPPTAPSLLSPAVGASGVALNPILNWSTSSKASSYSVQVSTASDFSSLVVDQKGLQTTNDTVSGLSSNTQYYWRASASNEAGLASLWSTVRSFTTLFVAAPSVPTLISPTSGTINVSLNPILTWNASVGAVTYRLQVSTNALFTAVIFDDSTAASITKNISALSSGTAYFWRVNAKNAGGISDWSMIWSFTTVPSVTDAPILSSPSNSSLNIALNPTLIWNAMSGAATYRIQVSTDSTFASIATDDSTVVSLSKSIGPLNPNTLYFWRVKAKNTGGTSPWSLVWHFTTVPPISAAPIQISPANNSSNNSIPPVLMWNSATGAATYHLQVSPNSGFTTIIVDDSTLSSTSKTVGTLNPNATYYWRINAKNAGGTSVWSAVWSFSTGSVSVLPFSFGVTFSGASFINGNIHYGIPKQSFVSIIIYDIKGHLVKNIISSQQQAGYYTVNFKQSRFATGQYFIRFKSGSYIRIIPVLAY